MKYYEQKLIDKLQSAHEYITSFGAPVCVKPIPDDDTPGVLDSRDVPYALAFAARDRSAQATLEGQRRQNGCINYNINTAAIITDCVRIDRGDRGMRLFLYWPRKPEDAAPRAAFIYIHGGSFFAGSPFVSDNTCRFLAEAADCVVINVEYALAPEHPYPAGLSDCRAALDYVFDNAQSLNIDRSRIGIGGDSAGACLAASVAATETQNRIALLGCWYPSTTFDYGKLPYSWCIDDFEMSDNERGLIEPKLCLGRMDDKGEPQLLLSILHMYLQGEFDIDDPAISPLYGTYQKLRRCIVFTAEYDGLRYQGEHLAALTASQGVPTRCIRYRGVFHAFEEKLGALPQAEDSVLELASELTAL